MLRSHLERSKAQRDNALTAAWYTGALAAQAVFASKQHPFPSLKELLTPATEQPQKQPWEAMLAVHMASSAARQEAAAKKAQS